MLQPAILSNEFRDVLHQLEHQPDHFFVTGKAGSGKSTLLNVFRNTTKKKLVVLAPTGIAALHVKGQTIHSFFGFPPRIINRQDIEKRNNVQVYRKVEVIVIDEISMVRADIMDNIDYFLRLHRGNNELFGGVQMIFFGDLFQLPPVVASPFEKEYFKNHFNSPYFFSAHCIRNVDLIMLELHQEYRQTDRHFIRLLDAIRKNEVDYDEIIDLNERHINLPEDKDFYITLCSRNDIANQINQRELEEITYPVFEYHAYVEGDFNTSIFPTDFALRLKREAQVMFIKNDVNKQYVNGTIGKIKDLTEDSVTVTILNEQKEVKDIHLDKMEWEIIKYEQDKIDPTKIVSRTIGLFRQYPLKLAWAITIHKSQGKTFERVIIDLGQGAFEAGQTYVALSRCKTLEGIILKSPIKPRDIIVNPEISEYYQSLR
ncbi:MAG: DEAD/DEAH box helicase [Saprospiraceae bacterium]